MNIRTHIDIFTGTPSANFYLNKSAEAYKDLYLFYGGEVPENVWAFEPELPFMAGEQYGFRLDGRLLSDIVASCYQRYLCNLYRVGIMSRFAEMARRPVAMEIGAGHGGFAHNFLSAFQRKPVYIIVDLPESLFYAAVFLTVHNADMRVYVYSPGDDLREVTDAIVEYDLVLVPDYKLADLKALTTLDLALNHVSFPEMSPTAIEAYLEFLAARLDGYLMSVNHLKRPESTLDPIDEVLDKYFIVSPRIDEIIAALGLNDTVRSDINFRATLVACSSSDWRSRLEGIVLKDIVGTTNQRYEVAFEANAATASLTT